MREGAMLSFALTLLLKESSHGCCTKSCHNAC